MKGDHVSPTAPRSGRDDGGAPQTGAAGGALGCRAPGAVATIREPRPSLPRWLGAPAWLVGTLVTLVVHAVGFGGCTLEVQGENKLEICTQHTDCTDNNPCTVDTCNDYSQCVFSPLDGTSEPLDQEPADCRLNICRGGQPVVELDPYDAYDDYNSCTVDTCDATTLETVHAPLAYGATCDDGGGNQGTCGCLGSSGLEECTGGVLPECQVACTVANAATVCEDQNFCTEDSCDVAAGYCLHAGRDLEPLPEDQQVSGDCRLMVCQDKAISPAPGIVDNGDVPADDGDVCTDEVCEGGFPEHPGNTAPCDDDVFCNGTDTCVPYADIWLGGECSAHTGDPCTGPDGDDNCSESCNEAANDCTAADPDASACTDGVYCNGADSCQAGSCTAHLGNPCPTRNPAINDCTQTCTEAGGGSCNGNDAQGAACNDGQYCNGTDTCDSSGSCSSHTNPPCSTNHSDNDCLGTCREATDDCLGPEPSGSPCDDGLYCTTTHQCNSSGACQGSGNPCPTDYSDADCLGTCNDVADNCSGPEPVNSPCDDNDYCTGTDRCNATGQCANHTGDPCSTDYSDANCTGTCNSVAGDCSGPEPVNSPCSDGDYCTGTDTCNASGVCANHTGDPCSTDYSDANCAGTCNSTAGDCSGPEPAGSPCADADLCNGTDTCNASGVCANHTGDQCAANLNGCDPNCKQSCNPTTGACDANDPNGSECDLDSTCPGGNRQETCTDGVCG